MIKVVLGIADCLLCEPLGKQSTARERVTGKGEKLTAVGSDLDDNLGPRMADELCEHLIRVLMDLWLKSGIRNVDMWNILQVITFYLIKKKERRKVRN